MSLKHIEGNDKSFQKLLSPPPAPPLHLTCILIHTSRYGPPPATLSRRVHVQRGCLYCTLPTPPPALRPAVGCVAAEIDKLTLKALCLRSLLEREEKHHLLAAERRQHTGAPRTHHSGSCNFNDAMFRQAPLDLFRASSRGYGGFGVVFHSVP